MIHCPVCGIGSDVRTTRVCFSCCHKHKTLTEALKEFGYSHKDSKSHGTRDIVDDLTGETVTEGQLCGSAWKWLRERATEKGDISE